MISCDENEDHNGKIDHIIALDVDIDTNIQLIVYTK